MSAPSGRPAEGAVETVDLRTRASDRDALLLVPEAYAAEHDALPLGIVGGALELALAEPGDAKLVAELRLLTRHEVRALAAPTAEIKRAIQQRYHPVRDLERAGASADGAPESASAVRVVDLLIRQALADRASDIHLEPQESRLRVRFRIDGLLADVQSLPRSLAPSIASRVKVMANMDIVDRHRAQDGQIHLQVENRDVDIRVSTLETIWGEKLVLRLLDQGRTVLKLDQLGLARQGYERLEKLLRSPYGMIVVSGPTGSGKTTTLYAAIEELDRRSQNITTIEDPVEYTFEDINQIQIRKVANLTFANGLKAILRQDPDVILVGEIRDQETAAIATQSALTGHLVLTSLHATDAAGVIQRFVEMGIEGFLVSSALAGVVAQRLVRRVCDDCKEPYQPSEEELQAFREHGSESKSVFYRGAGCDACAHTGYRGRIGVFEVMPLSDRIRRLASERASADAIREAALSEGMVTMKSDAISKVAADVTTLAEAVRSVWVL